MTIVVPVDPEPVPSNGGPTVRSADMDPNCELSGTQPDRDRFGDTQGVLPRTDSGLPAQAYCRLVGPVRVSDGTDARHGQVREVSPSVRAEQGSPRLTNRPKMRTL
jgi:hypothetical protein